MTVNAARHRLGLPVDHLRLLRGRDAGVRKIELAGFVEVGPPGQRQVDRRAAQRPPVGNTAFNRAFSAALLCDRQLFGKMKEIVTKKKCRDYDKWHAVKRKQSNCSVHG